MGTSRGEDAERIATVNAAEKLQRGERVSINEIVETYCQLTPTPEGKVPAPGTLELLRQKAAEAAARGLLLEGPSAV